jgi:trk system potassium uptake protein TrkA
VAQQVLVIGLGAFGAMVARELAGLGHEVMGGDRDPVAVADLANDLTSAVELDATDDDALGAIGPADFDVVVVALDRPATIFATMLLEQRGVGTIVARAMTELDGEILRRVGADRVIYPDAHTAGWLARTIDLAGAIDYVRLSPDVAAVHLRIGQRAVGRTIGEIVDHSGALRVAALHRGDDVVIDPVDTTVLAEGDSLLVIGPDEAFRALAG